jgi:hypothetical protein
VGHNRAVNLTHGERTDGVQDRFKPTSGQFVGWAGLVGCLGALGWCLWNVHTHTGAQVGLGAAFAGVIVWTTQLRPRATAYDDRVVLLNMVTDVTVPYSIVQDVLMGQYLTIWADDRKYVCIGIGQSYRDEMRKRRKELRKAPTQLGESRWHQFSREAEMAAPDVRDVTYQNFIVTRLEELIDKFKRDHPQAPPAVARRSVALLPTGALLVTGLAFAVSLLVL